ncbi:hypothetical protein, partial [Kitasatospora cineracea]|uniref:hypothetical protein n=1 Tax=Kitasatospora cineracea TaxID=88074 RepID=UPI00348495E6
MAQWNRRGRAALAAVMGGTLLLSGCGIAGIGDDPHRPADLRALLPERVRKAGVVTVGASFTGRRLAPHARPAGRRHP